MKSQKKENKKTCVFYFFNLYVNNLKEKCTMKVIEFLKLTSSTVSIKKMLLKNQTYFKINFRF